MVFFGADLIKKLAKNDYNQTLISNKELGFKFFRNEFDLSPLQLNFLMYVNQYNGLYTDVALKECSILVLKNDFYAECYSKFKYKKRESDSKKKPEVVNNQPTNKNPLKKEITKSSKWIFTAPKKG